MEINSEIDSAFLDLAEEEIYQILLYQHLSYNDRWNSNFISVKIAPLIRVLGVALSLIGILLSLYVIWQSPDWCPAWVNIYYYLAVFIICSFIFYFLPNMNKALNKWNRNYAYKNCKKLAKKCIKAARLQVPYIAQYHIEDDSISYYREKDSEPYFVWKRKLKGIAIQGKYATLVFRKRTSFVAKIVLLHEDSDAMISHLRKSLIQTYPMEKYID